MLLDTDSVCVGLSGGADSVCLLRLLLECKSELGLKTVTACHINHLLRGEDSENDEAFVRSLCGNLSVPLQVFRVDVGLEAKKRKIGLEQCGRQIRYECFSQCADVIATAHNACDNAETVLFNIARGTALDGLTGIMPVNNRDGLRIIRPLISFTRDEIEQYLAEIEQDYVTDKTNFETVYNRNIIRLNVIPELKKINPSFEKSVMRMNETLSCDNAYLEGLAKDAQKKAEIGRFMYDVSKLKALPVPIISRFCKNCLWTLKIDPTKEKIGYILDAINLGSKVSIGFGWYADGKNGTLVFYNESDFFDFEYPLTFGDLRINKGKTVNIKLLDKKTFDSLRETEKNYLYHTLDYDKILSWAVVRNRRDGDTVKLHGRGFTNKIKKLFCESVPEFQRDSRVIIADRQGVIFVEGFGTAQRTRVTDDSENILYITIKDTCYE